MQKTISIGYSLQVVVSPILIKSSHNELDPRLITSTSFELPQTSHEVMAERLLSNALGNKIKTNLCRIAMILYVLQSFKT